MTSSAHVDRSTDTGFTDRHSVRGRSPWSGVLSVTAAAFALVLSEFLPLGLLDYMSDDFGVTHGVAGTMLALPALVACAAAPLVTAYAGAMDRRTLLLVLTLCIVIADVWVAFAPTFETALIGRVLLGIAVGGFWSIGPPSGGRLVGPEHATRATAFIVGGVSIATVVSLPLGAWLASAAPWRWAFGLAAIVSAMALIAQMVTLPSMPPIGAVQLRRIFSLLAVRPVRHCLTITGAVFIGHFAAYTYIKSFAIDIGLGAHMPAILLSFGLLGVATNFAGGWVLDSHHREVLVGALLVAGVSLLALPLVAASSVATVALLLIWGTTWGVVPLSLQVWILTTAPSTQGGGQALFVTVIQAALASGAIVGGMAVDALGVSAAYYCGGSVLFTAAVGASWALRPTAAQPAI